jgi:hypothetical protein
MGFKSISFVRQSASAAFGSVYLVWGDLSLLDRSPLRSNVDSGNVVEESKDVQEPQNHGNDHNAVQNRLDLSLHGDEAIHQPQENTYHNQNFQELN